MIKKNTQHIVKIQSVTAKGFGIGSVNDFTLFVDGGLPGDEVLAHILKVKRRYGYGKILDIITSSPSRIKSPCPVSDRCGGCQWQHCEYSAQLGFKKQIATDALTRIGGIENPPVADVIGMEPAAQGGAPLEWRYRNKAVFPVVPADNGDGFAIGMYAPRSHRIIEVTDCGIQHEAHVGVLRVIKEHMRRHKISAYDETIHKGLVRHVMVRTGRATGEVMVVLSVNGKKIPGEAELCERLAALEITTAIISRHESKGNAILGEHFRVLYGPGFIRERLGGKGSTLFRSSPVSIEYQLSAPSFFQVNPAQATVLYDVALAQAGLDGTQTVIDAHAGVGGVALYVAQFCKDVIGVDIVPEAIEDAKKNAVLNGIENARFICGAAEDIIPKLLTDASSRCAPDVIFLDPPRKGCEPALLDALISAKIERIVYISCDPATLARDIKMLVNGGYNLAVAQPVDMFPMTGKVETSVLLRRDDT
ncbi:MAG: 23S rRNA (uracil(1939)-C(5))-methyltransferase RlmD [Defluviitaleaceae bacterium]|nr:23S rRNA (uracil(1939)-C(5))-methyltransferase RlmD [Defluviitaleaceae bacterium]